MSNILYIEKNKGGDYVNIRDSNLEFKIYDDLDSEVDNNIITVSKRISIDEFNIILENSKVIETKEDNEGNIIIKVTTDRLF